MRADLNPAYLGQIERGLKCPTIDTLYKIVRALEISLPEFFAFDAPNQAKDASEQLHNIIATVSPDKAERFTKLIGELASLIQD